MLSATAASISNSLGPLLSYSGVAPPDMTEISLNGLLGALEIGPGIKTAALGKSGFVGVK